MLPFSKIDLVWTLTRLALLVTLVLIGPAALATALGPILPVVLLAVPLVLISFLADRGDTRPGTKAPRPSGHHLSIRS